VRNYPMCRLQTPTVSWGRCLTQYI
jgi:hypothetical protein